MVLAAKPGVGADAPQVRAFPSPTASATTFEVTLPKAGPVRIALFSITGAKVAEVPVGAAALPAGTHRISYQNPALPAGVYFYTVTPNGGTYCDKAAGGIAVDRVECRASRTAT